MIENDVVFSMYLKIEVRVLTSRVILFGFSTRDVSCMLCLQHVHHLFKLCQGRLSLSGTEPAEDMGRPAFTYVTHFHCFSLSVFSDSSDKEHLNGECSKTLVFVLTATRA